MDRMLGLAGKAVGERAWQEAFDGFRAVDEADGLSPEDLESFSDAAFWSGHVREAIDARQRAFSAYDDAGRMDDAAATAVSVALMNFGAGDTSMASGWLGRAQRLLSDMPECGAHGLLAWLEGQIMGRLKGHDQALEKANEVQAIGRRLGDRDLVALGLSMEGFLRMHVGEARAGIALMGESLASALAGELGTFASAEVFCEMVLSCITTADFQRAAEWLDTAERTGFELACFPGCCRVHRSTVLRNRGEWSEADRQARQALAEVTGVEVLHEGMALTELGELHRCRGELSLAEQEFNDAYEKGWPPQPGLALLRLRSGDTEGASRLIQRAIESSADEPSALVRLLLAQVEIAIACEGDESATIDAACARLGDVVTTMESSTAEAAKATVAGMREVRQGNLVEAARQLEVSVKLWQQVRSPYDVAQNRVRLGRVLADLGDGDSAKLELTAARKTFERLGATPEARETARLLGDASPKQALRTFMFTDIVNSTSLLSVIGDEAWDSVRRWHDRTVKTAVSEHHGTVVKGTGDGFFVVFEDPALAVDCAVAIQSALANHRREEGFSPAVRIGLHTGSAICDADDYSGQDVVVAARISALAGADEILVSAAVADRAGPHVTVAGQRVVELKGIPAPVEVLSVSWR